MFWLMLAVLVILGAAAAMARRRRYEAVDTEPWRASLREDDEPLDLDEARRAEEEFLASDWQEREDDEEWRG
jgi:hypothetical protein